MRIFHLGDLHFGKMLYAVPMLEEDQPYWVERFLEKVDEYDPQVILIAGDVYDRRDPGKEAVKLFDYFLTQLRRRNKIVLIIAGNHDSGIKLSFAGEILSNEQIHIAGEVTREVKCVSLEDEYGPINFWLLPYLYPRIVSDPTVLDRDDIRSYDQAVRELLAVQKLDAKVRNIILVHQNVLANGKQPEHSESETIVGGLGEVEADAFDAFDYVAMGHIHNAQHMGRETVRYAGCPMYYDFSEEKREKYLTMVDLHEKGNVQITPVSIPLKHKMKVLTGEVQDILQEGEKIADKKDYYFQAVVQDRHLPVGTQDRLRAMFGENLINVKREIPRSETYTGEKITLQQREEMTVKELFADFYTSQNDGSLMNDLQETLVSRILEQQSRSGADYCDEAKNVPQAEVEELMEYLLKSVDEEVREECSDETK